jgi:hypothetical protein
MDPLTVAAERGPGGNDNDAPMERRMFKWALVTSLSVAACTGTVTETTASGTGHESTSTGSSSTTTTSSAASSGGDGGISCYDCACYRLSGDNPPGCADVCNAPLGAPNFCDTVPLTVKPMCAACIGMRCGEPDPSKCSGGP